MAGFKFSNDKFEIELEAGSTDTCNMNLTIKVKDSLPCDTPPSLAPVNKPKDDPDAGHETEFVILSQAESDLIESADTQKVISLWKGFTEQMREVFESHTTQDSRHQFHFHNIDRKDYSIILDHLLRFELIQDAQWLDISKKAALVFYFNLDLNSNVDHDGNLIIAAIRNITDNQTLTELHKDLLSEEWDYLRSDLLSVKPLKRPQQIFPSPQTPLRSSIWTSSLSIPVDTIAVHRSGLLFTKPYQGTDKEGKIVRTSKTWAAIEKAISLQLALNELPKHEPITPALGLQIAGSLSTQHSFFAIPRTKTDREKSNLLVALEAGDMDRLARISQKTFGKITT